MRVLALTRYARLGASSRMRFLQYIPHLERTGIEVDVSPLFSDEYVLALQSSNRHSKARALSGLLRRLFRMLNAGQHDLLWIEKEALPWIPHFVERMLMPRNCPIVLDYDDAVFHYYDMHRRWLVRSLLGTKHEKLMSDASMVIAGNPYIATHASRCGARCVHLLPTVVDLDRYPEPRFDRDDVGKSPVIGWIGQRHNAHYLEHISQSVRQIHKEGKASFLAIGAGKGVANLPFEAIPWSEATETRDISRFDIGIMPLPDEPFERGKCGYKLIQYMACGKPVIASPVGVNADIVEHGVNGYLASTPQEWDQALRSLAGDPEMRNRMGRAGRLRVAQTYSLQATAPRLAALLTSAINSKR